jgi:hypothetical protein
MDLKSLNSAYEKPIDEVVGERRESKEDCINVSLGTDPEFARRVRDLSRYPNTPSIERYMWSPARDAFTYDAQCKCGELHLLNDINACPHCRAGIFINSVGNLSRDGHPWLFEARPEASIWPENVVHNLHLLIKALMKYTNPDQKLYAGPMCDNRAVGGHIHIGFPDAVEFGSLTNGSDGDDYDRMCRRTMAYLHSGRIAGCTCKYCLADTQKQVCTNQGLSRTISLLLLPLISPYGMEGEDGRHRRYGSNVNGAYGMSDDNRNQPWGWEWRTPGSHLVSPWRTLVYLYAVRAAYKISLTSEFKNRYFPLTEVNNGPYRREVDRCLMNHETKASYLSLTGGWHHFWRILNASELLAMAHVDKLTTMRDNVLISAYIDKTNDSINEAWDNCESTLIRWANASDKLAHRVMDITGQDSVGWESLFKPWSTTQKAKEIKERNSN